ncbi:MAG: hypothetical protein K2L18_00705, partial [Acetatifactor sp.]|nr:hypothetical protein [Acetatifactor sp.]
AATGWLSPASVRPCRCISEENLKIILHFLKFVFFLLKKHKFVLYLGALVQSSFEKRINTHYGKGKEILSEV